MAQLMEASGGDRQHQKLMQLWDKIDVDYLEEMP